MSNLKLEWATHKSALYACQNWHYSKCLPAGKLVKVGVREDGKFIGAVIYGRGASPFLLKKYGLRMNEGCELVRVALDKHTTPVTKIIKVSLIFLKKAAPSLRLVVSFADPEEGHIGGIYKAGNWIYTGKSNETTEVYVRGKWTHMRGAFHQMNSSTPTRIRKGKFRYLMPLDSSMREDILPLRIPYPKDLCALSDTKDTSGNLPEEGISTMTSALHLSSDV